MDHTNIKKPSILFIAGFYIMNAVPAWPVEVGLQL
jgi:hypothetical protein